jgi:alpha-L-fucosidase
MAVDVFDHIRKLDSAIIINNRLDKGREGFKGTTRHGFLGDYDTPEQRIGILNLNRPWESNITIGTQWSWKPNDSLKTAAQCLHTLTRTAGGNGNLLLNVGPMPDGRIEQRQTAILLKIGNWLQQYGDAIYGTTGGPFPPTEEMASTRKGNKVYVHLLKYPGNVLHLKGLRNIKILHASFLKGNDVQIEKTADGILIHLPGNLPDANDSVIEITLDRSAVTLPIFKQ